MNSAHDAGRYSVPRPSGGRYSAPRLLRGWHNLLQGYPWFAGEGSFPLAAYSEFMPPPRVGRRPYGDADSSLFTEDDPFGWHVTEAEEEYELQPGLASLAHQILDELVELGQGGPAHRVAGHQRRNLDGNPYWPPELAARAGQLPHERYVIFSPLSLSRTQDDKGRVRWTFFGGSEQGPELAFWKSFYSAPGEERPAGEALAFLARLLSTVFDEPDVSPSNLRAAGLRILPTETDPRFPYWHAHPLPSWTAALLWDEGNSDGVRYLLTFRPFSALPSSVRQSYLAGQLVLLPFPGSLVFWGVPIYARLQQEMPMAMQLPLQRVAARHGGPSGIKVPQSGWFFESGKDFQSPQVQQKLLLNTYRRTSRWDRVRRYENEVVLSTIEDRIARVLFGTELDVMGLYGKPMARNSQLWTEDGHFLLDGPHAAREELERAARVVAQGGAFRYRFEFPAMRVGLHEVYWQRPLAAYWCAARGQVELLDGGPLGYLTAYLPAKPDLAHPVELWPRLLRREPYLWALRNFEHLQEHYKHQTALNVLRLLDTWRRWGYKPLPRSFARQVLRLAEREPLETWLGSLAEKASNPAEGRQLRETLEHCLEPMQSTEPHTSLPGVPPPADLPPAITFGQTATRAFEEAWWNDIRQLSGRDYVTKDNADSVRDPATLALLPYRHRDLERLGDHLLQRYKQTIAAAGMQGKAFYGELPFHWHTDFDFSVFGGWANDQEGHTHERDLLVIIPGRNRKEAVIMADHYDTAYMEDVYDPSRGGSGARIAAPGADDNCSATATLLQAAPVFLQLSKEGRLERDVWLVHLTGEEFPSDCMGARHLAQAMVQKTLRLRLSDGGLQDLSDVRVVGVYVLDMIGHNRENDLDDFQISPGKGRASQRLAWHAHMANLLWNVGAKEWNQRPERRDKGRGQPSAGGGQIPPIAAHLRLEGEVRLNEDPHSSLFNTDGQIFSDCGVPVVLFMENYDINRSGYHDTKDTLENIDLDYGAAVAAIAIETVARVATDTTV
jgi:hypothetical protein